MTDAELIAKAKAELEKWADEHYLDRDDSWVNEIVPLLCDALEKKNEVKP